MDQPRKRKAQRVRVVESVDRQIASFAKGRIDAAGRPRVFAINIVAEHHRMHNREDAGATIIVLLYLIVVRKQARYAGRALLEDGGDEYREEGVEIAALQHSLECLLRRQKLD